ncbi:MAG: GNAT family N-acetyltransferase [Thermoplasmata archaeon]
MELRPDCGRCHTSLSGDHPAYICAQECTFCATCYRQLKYVCPNCSGELVRRPRPGPVPSPRHSVPPPHEARVAVRRATIEDVETVAPLFDAYRQFYEQSTDLPAARAFLRDRLFREESVVLIAEQAGRALGFTQLYPLFSSVSLGPIYVLNDLFVDPSARRKGVAAQLLEAARKFGGGTGAHYLELSTAVDNPAQRLYEACDWTLDREFLHYELLLRANSNTG